MTAGIVRITDKNFRITIPEDIRDIENISQGDYIKIDVVKLGLNNTMNNSKKVNKKKSLNDSISDLNAKLDMLPDRIADAINRKNSKQIIYEEDDHNICSI